MSNLNNKDLFERIRFRGCPQAAPGAIVHASQARFTVLTPRLIRMEWSETGVFEDRATYAFPNRHAGVPFYDVDQTDEKLVLRTEALELCFRKGAGRFSSQNLSITFELNGSSKVWTPDMPDPLNLRGTRRTLDECDGDVALEAGLLSRSGWFLFDDSRAVVFNDEDGWVAPRPDNEFQDWYFFAYGRAYKLALAEYSRFGGPVPLIPRFVLGAWWSRYWAYSAQDLKDLICDFEFHDLPLDVLVVDMDWHTPQTWTGYTWNRELFPDPVEFLQWVHDKGLQATFNLHPAQGVQHFEEIYTRFAEAMGVDPKLRKSIPFRITDKRFVKNYFELLHHTMEEEGVDFWWLDWQQGEATEMKGLDALPWLNHLHFQDSIRRGSRPMLYSRWGGLGNHRYHIGFSGDTVAGWPALQFQPYFTATASNVAYGWWSHDIGGHMGGETEPELYARWVQYGAVSPCLRLHATNDPRCERRPWAYPKETFEAAKAAFHLRYRLIPYLYSMARSASDTSVSLCRPMYYEYPEEESAYAARYQYFFGDQMLAAPFVFPADPNNGLASQDVWVPPGEWIDFSTHELFTGPRWVRLVGDLNALPMLVKAGGIIPLAPDFDQQAFPKLASGTSDALPRDRLVLSVFPGEAGVFRMYEDDGISLDYRTGQFEWTEIRTKMIGRDTWEVEVDPVEGVCSALPETRSYEIRLEGSSCPDRVMVEGMDQVDWRYDPRAIATIITIPSRAKSLALRVRATARSGISALGADRNSSLVLDDVKRLLGDSLPDALVDLHDALEITLGLEGTGRDDALARLGGPFVRTIPYVTPEEASRQLGRILIGGPARLDEPYDLLVEFKLEKAGQLEPDQFSVQRSGVYGTQIIDTPFAYEHPCSMRWEVSVGLSWRASQIKYNYRSDLLFSTIHNYQVLFYDRNTHPVTANQIQDAAGRLNQTLSWKAYSQSGPALASLSQPYRIHLSHECQAVMEAGRAMAGYLAAHVESLEEQEAVLLFEAEGELEFFLNGKKLVGDPVEAGQVTEVFKPHPFLKPIRKLEGIRLRKGKNILLIHTAPLPVNLQAWYFGGVFANKALEWVRGITIVVNDD